MTWLAKYQRNILALWAMALITAVVVKLIIIIDAIDLTTTGLLTVIVGILSAVLAFYVRDKELDQLKIQVKEKELELMQAKLVLNGEMR